MPTGPGADRAFAIATSLAKRQGFSSFKAGSAGAERRGQFAEKIAAKHKGGKGYGRKPR